MGDIDPILINNQPPGQQGHYVRRNARPVPVEPTSEPTSIRTFQSGATRDSDAGKLDYEGFLSPLVLERFAEYMNQHRTQPDGALRDSDNWQKGIPKTQYLKSLWRHFVDVWKILRGVPALERGTGREIQLDEALCAVLFNAMGLLHEVLKDDRKKELREPAA